MKRKDARNKTLEKLLRILWVGELWSKHGSSALASIKLPESECYNKKTAERAWYVPTGNIISRQVIGVTVVPVVTEYRTTEFYDKKKDRNVHSAFPKGVANDVNYDGSIKAVLFLLNSRCNVSLEKTARFVSDITNGALSPCVGMISGLCREFSP